ncbi:MAG: M48 family metallopeptidase [Cytophagaceae bacterium]
MNRALIHFAVGIILFGSTWFLLSRIDYVGIMGVENFEKANEEKLGKVIVDFIKKKDKEVDSDSIKTFINDLKDRICKNNDIDPEGIKVHVIYSSEINAFALPGRNMVILTGLIDYSNSPEEIAGVMAHEIAHMEHNHVMKKLIKEVGASILLTLAMGDKGGGEILKETVKLLTSSAFDRKQESEADASAVKYMAKANMDPEHLANFLFRLSLEKEHLPKEFEWISTHPDSKERANEILKLKAQEEINSVPVTEEGKWNRIKTLNAELGY